MLFSSLIERYLGAKFHFVNPFEEIAKFFYLKVPFLMASDSLAINLVRFTANIIMKNWSTIPFEHLYNIAFLQAGGGDSFTSVYFKIETGPSENSCPYCTLCNLNLEFLIFPVKTADYIYFLPAPARLDKCIKTPIEFLCISSFSSLIKINPS